MQKHLFLSNPCLLDHGSSNHPENADRLKTILAKLQESPYKQFVDLSISRLATETELSQVHDPAYVSHVLSLKGKESSLDDETILSPGSVKAALMAAGLSLELVEQILEEKIENGFVLARPPGHHAQPAAGMGYCVFNNIALAARQAISRGIERILILDWDVHHGNGTQEIFYDEDRVLFIDLHQENLFPAASGLVNETGQGKGSGFTVNVPLCDSCRDADYLYIFEKLVRPLALEYRPELILVSAGFDAHESDPMGFMSLTTRCFGLLTSKVKSLAHEVCGGKVAFFLEGGYNSFFLAQNVMECIGVLANETAFFETTEGELQPSCHAVEKLVKEIYEAHIK